MAAVVLEKQSGPRAGSGLILSPTTMSPTAADALIRLHPDDDVAVARRRDRLPTSRAPVNGVL